MPSRIIALKHIIRSMPVFYLMLLDFTQAGYRKLEAISRSFLWGFRPDGKAKSPLVAWSKITNSKAYGGLGVIDFQRQARFFKLRFLSQILAGHQSKWVQLVTAEFTKVLQKGPYKEDLRTWTSSEFLLLMPEIKLTSKVVCSLLTSWK
jgi:hypothetical protein